MYLRYPDLFQSRIIFVGDDSLWLAHENGGSVGRLSEAMEKTKTPKFSPDGKNIAFAAKGGLYLMSSEGGVPHCIFAVSHPVVVVGWQGDAHVLMISNFRHYYSRFAYRVCVETGQAEEIPIGPCDFLFYGPSKGCVIQRDGYGYVPWKRYQGGTAGKLWIDREGDGSFVRLLEPIKYNILCPMWIEDRIFFLSDYEGHGNLYSCSLEGQDLRRMTDHTNFYPQQSASDGKRIVYACGGEIFLFQGTDSCKVSLSQPPSRLDKMRDMENPADLLSEYQLSHDGKRLSIITRGRLFQLTPYKGPVTQHGLRDGVRYRFASFFKDSTLLVLCDEGLRETWAVYEEDQVEPVLRVESFDLDLGRITDLMSSPVHKTAVCMNHRHELIWLDFEQKKARLVDTSPKGAMRGVSWSACGRWIAYSRFMHPHGSSLFVYDVEKQENHCVLDDFFFNTKPVFDPEGKYLYFLSSRFFEPQWSDSVHDFMNWGGVTKPFALVLQKDQDSPFVLPLMHNGDLDDSSNEDSDDDGSDKRSEGKSEENHTVRKAPVHTQIDFEGIQDRMVSFPLPNRTYKDLVGLEGQLLYTVAGKKTLELFGYDLSLLKEELLVPALHSFALSQDGKWMTYGLEDKLRTVRAGIKVEEMQDPSFRKGGWLDLDRVVLTVCRKKEWQQMFDEAWRLRRDHYWRSDMAGVDWDAVYQQYRPCVDRVSCFSEMKELLLEMQGESGTSHSYVKDSRDTLDGATLGADFVYDDTSGAYRIHRWMEGNVWENPLRRPGLNLHAGDLVWAVSGQPLSKDVSPEAILQNYGPHKEEDGIFLVVSDKEGQKKRVVTVFAVSIQKEQEWRYRQWVNQNRKWVHEKSQGRVGYVHIPDMIHTGYGEFIKFYFQEFDREGLIVDVRYNGGGNISFLLLDYLTRKRIGIDQSRYEGMVPYPAFAPRGPMAALCNQFTGSDGDIFSQSFKQMGLGPLIGKRTWGGVIGIWPKYDLIDGTMITHPEYSFWFHGMGWGVENHGVDPTIEVEVTPQDQVKGLDPQLERGVKEVLALITKGERLENLMEASKKPNLAAPLLPV